MAPSQLFGGREAIRYQIKNFCGVDRRSTCASRMHAGDGAARAGLVRGDACARGFEQVLDRPVAGQGSDRSPKRLDRETAQPCALRAVVGIDCSSDRERSGDHATGDRSVMMNQSGQPPNLSVLL